MYMVHYADETASLEAAESAINRFKTAVYSRNTEDIFRSVIEIDSAVELLQRIDADLSAKSQLHYFQLFFFFSMLIIIIILGMRFLNSRLEKAEKRERQTLIFSRETIMAQETERKRIACELHDTVLQDMWRLSFKINSEETAKEQREIMQRIRGICDSLIPPDFQIRGLINALQSLCYNFRRRTDIECHVTIQENLCIAELDTDTQLQCYRIVQECLSNTEKHAKASQAIVQIRKSADNFLLISVSDNGKGFNPADINSTHSFKAEKHFGVRDINERAAYINASVKIKSNIGEGTIITLKVPLPAKEDNS